MALTLEQLDQATNLVNKQQFNELLDYLVSVHQEKSNLKEMDKLLHSEAFKDGYTACADVYMHLMRRRREDNEK